MGDSRTESHTRRNDAGGETVWCRHSRFMPEGAASSREACCHDYGWLVMAATGKGLPALGQPTVSGSCAGEPISSHWRSQRGGGRVIPSTVSEALRLTPALQVSHHASRGSAAEKIRHAICSVLAMACWYASIRAAGGSTSPSWAIRSRVLPLQIGSSQRRTSSRRLRASHLYRCARRRTGGKIACGTARDVVSSLGDYSFIAFSDFSAPKLWRSARRKVSTISQAKMNVS